MPATAMPWPASTPTPTDCLDQAADVGGERFHLAGAWRVAADVALGVADDPGLERVVEGDLAAGADDQLGRAAADVDDQGRLGGQSLGGGAEVGGAGLLLAVEDAGREREALAQLGDEGAAVAGVADGAGRDRVDRLGTQLLDDADVVADRRADVLDRLGGEPAGEVDAAAQPGHGAAPLAPARPAPRRRRRPATASSWSRCRSPRPALPHRSSGHSKDSRRRSPLRKSPAGSRIQPTATPTLLASPVRRGVEQPGSSSGS